MRYIPKYCRIMRMQRTMSADEIEAGVEKSNFRELVEDETKKKGIHIEEIRYREIGKKFGKLKNDHIEIFRIDYAASGGKEVFLSFEDCKNGTISGFIRIRFSENSPRKEITGSTAMIRELHVYGPTIPIGNSEEGAIQHRGLGRKLLEEAEYIAKHEFKKTKMIVISGVGVREYYRKHGYESDGPYMSKQL